MDADVSPFDALVDWLHDEAILYQGAPGLLVGLSGTDSVVAFLACYKALERAGKPGRMMGVHFAPSEDFLYDHPEAESHLWFSHEVIPWLRQQTPHAKVVIDTSIDWRCDGLRWGALADMSVVSNEHGRAMRPPDEQYWVVGTRNKTEDALFNYSNASTLVSLQPLIHLWKSDILAISESLGVPKVAITRSCEADCICGRMGLPARHAVELDALLMGKREEVPEPLRAQLEKFIVAQFKKGRFKANIPYVPDQLVFAFESGTLPLAEFNHRKHLYVAWYYLGLMPFDGALERYASKLKPLLERGGYGSRFSLEITKGFFERLNAAMEEHGLGFDELLLAEPSLLDRKASPPADIGRVGDTP